LIAKPNYNDRRIEDAQGTVQPVPANNNEATVALGKPEKNFLSAAQSRSLRPAFEE
jgi:hypothetical protein